MSRGPMRSRADIEKEIDDLIKPPKDQEFLVEAQKAFLQQEIDELVEPPFDEAIPLPSKDPILRKKKFKICMDACGDDSVFLKYELCSNKGKTYSEPCHLKCERFHLDETIRAKFYGRCDNPHKLAYDPPPPLGGP